MVDISPRLNASVDAMRQYFPAFALQSSITASGLGAVWRGTVQPIQTAEGLPELLDDIHNERQVYVLIGGEVRHHPRCKATHKHYDWMDRLIDPLKSFELEIKYEGGKKHPKAYILQPALPLHKRRHLFSDSSICSYAPWRGVWHWERDTVIDYMGHVLGWLIKWIVWEQADIWIGPEIDHNPGFLARSIGRNQECWCGSGRKYKKCHLPEG